MLRITLDDDTGSNRWAERIRKPSWNAMNLATRRLDRFCYPFIWLTQDPDIEEDAILEFNVMGGEGEYTMDYDRPLEFTALCRSIERIWFLLQRGQLHYSRRAIARACLSTGVLTVRRTVGQLCQVLGCVEITVNGQAAVLTAEHAVCQRKIAVYPATT